MTLEYIRYINHFDKRYWRPLPGNLTKLLHDYFQTTESQRGIIQIGSNDGISGDPIYPYLNSTNMTAVLVEPVPGLFAKLKENYANKKNIKCVNAAISASDEPMPFYVVDNTEKLFPEYFNQLGSFNKSMIEKQRRDYPSIDKYIKVINVPCKTFELLVSDAGLDSCPFLHIDAEGYDLDILEKVDIDKFGYKAILFEHVHLDEMRYRRYLAVLSKKGYKLWDCGTDTLAMKSVH